MLARPPGSARRPRSAAASTAPAPPRAPPAGPQTRRTPPRTAPGRRRPSAAGPARSMWSAQSCHAPGFRCRQPRQVSLELCGGVSRGAAPGTQRSRRGAWEPGSLCAGLPGNLAAPAPWWHCFTIRDFQSELAPSTRSRTGPWVGEACVHDGSASSRPAPRRDCAPKRGPYPTPSPTSKPGSAHLCDGDRQRRDLPRLAQRQLRRQVGQQRRQQLLVHAPRLLAALKHAARAAALALARLQRPLAWC